MVEYSETSEVAYVTFNVCLCPPVDSVSLWQRSLPAVRMLPEWKQLYRHPADLRLLHADGCGHRLHHAFAGHGGASEEGETERLFKFRFVVLFDVQGCD